MPRKNMRKLAYEIAELLTEYGCESDVYIYCDNKRLVHKGGKWEEHSGFSPDKYFEYCNLETLSMSFEGPFYDVLNYDALPELEEKFTGLLQEYNLYYELGNGWNLSLYEI